MPNNISTTDTSLASFAGLFFLSLWLSGKLHILDNRGEVWKALVVMVPLLAGTLIAVSRIMDARHHPFDVITGSLLGVACAWISYRQYFPPISQAWKKGRAYPIRTWASEPRGPPFSQFVDDSKVPLAESISRPDAAGFEPARSAGDVENVFGSAESSGSSSRRNRRRHGSGVWSPSSSTSDDIAAEGFEMYPNPGLGYSRAAQVEAGAAYDPRAGRQVTET